MEVAFESIEVRQLCENAAHASAKLGAKVAESLIRRVADLGAATSVSDLLAGRPRQLNEHMVVDLSDDFIMVFAANHNKNPLNATNCINWQKVTRVRILEISKVGG